MDYKLSIYFANGKDLTVVLKDSEFNKFLDDMAEGKPHWNEDKISGFSVPLFNVLYYTCIEYTEEMKKSDEERVKQAQAQAQAAKQQKEEEVKEIKEENK